MSKGSARRPGRGYEEGHERIWGRRTTRCHIHPDEVIDEEKCPKCGKEKKK